jgi:hypothetical protein
MRRPEDAILAAKVTSFRRIIDVVALAKAAAVMAPAARVKLNALTASTSQAAFAVNFPEGGSRGRRKHQRRPTSPGASRAGSGPRSRDRSHHCLPDHLDLAASEPASTGGTSPSWPL